MFLIILIVVIIALIDIDLGIVHRRAQLISYYEALALSGFWIAMGLAFSVFIYFNYEYGWFDGYLSDPNKTGSQAVMEYLTAYIVEKTLSMDNLFVIAMIFTTMQIPVRFHHRVLIWGILGAILFRGLMIFGGLALINKFDWVIYIFGAILIFSAFKLLANQKKPSSLAENGLVRFLSRHLPVTDNYRQGQFFDRIDGKLYVTTLFIALLLIETADVLFAFDSIPAVMAISRDPVIVYSSNIFAILGLRALYFVLANAITKLRYLKLGLVIILFFIGPNMIISDHYPIQTFISLSVILSILTISVFLSLRHKHLPDFIESSPLAQDIGKLYKMTYAGIKSITILVVGVSVILVGVVMIFTPGPAIIVIPAGLAILATEFVWARMLLKKFKTKFVEYSKETRSFFSRDDRNNTPKDQGQ